MMPEAWAIIAIGSNLGSTRENVVRAMSRLGVLSDFPLLKSSIWQSAPIDCPPGSPDFVNAVVALRPRASETPETLLARLQAMEKEFGRKPKTIRNESRPLDLDLIAFGNEIRDTPALILPHPRALTRRFVLQPLCEVAPGLCLPGQKQTVVELLSALPPDQTIRKLDEATRGSGFDAG